MSRRLTLSEALKTGRVAEFIVQEEERGVEGVDRNELDEVLSTVIKPPRSEDQTSRSPYDGNSTER